MVRRVFLILPIENLSPLCYNKKKHQGEAMNKNQNIAMGISLAVVAIMVGSAEIFGEKEIIFPEITAVAMGALIAPVQSWNTSRARLFAAIVSAAVAGVCIVRFIPEILILCIALGLLVAVSVITLAAEYAA